MKEITKKKTYYHLVLDKSGSMETCWTEAKQVINNQLEDLKRIQAENSNSEIQFSMCVFNHELKFSPGLMDVKTAKIDWENIQPDGMTSLYDAIGESISFINKEANEELSNKDSDVVMLIMTDGHENSSKKHTGDDIKEMIQACEKTEKWNFLYLGAGINVEDVTEGFGQSDKNSFSFNKENIHHAFNLVNEELEEFIRLKSKGQKKINFFDKGKDPI